MRFRDKVVVVTGAAGGVGQALVRLFAREGARLLLADFNEPGCVAVAEEARRLGAEAEYLAGDLRDKPYCEAVIERAVECFAGVDILLNNAGIIPRGTIETTTDDMWFDAMNVNLNAVFFLCRAAIPHETAGRWCDCQHLIGLGHLPRPGPCCLLHQQRCGGRVDPQPGP
ncbi:MAG: SDR family NAD(P)-dependent oxidoreductase [Thiolinea sp.]